MDDSGSTFPFVFNNCISVKAAAFHSGNNVQYLRRLLRDGSLSGMKLGQTWLMRSYRVSPFFYSPTELLTHLIFQRYQAVKLALRKNWALMATITVLSDIKRAPTAGESRKPKGASTPAASGSATTLYPVAQIKFSFIFL